MTMNLTITIIPKFVAENDDYNNDNADDNDDDDGDDFFYR